MEIVISVSLAVAAELAKRKPRRVGRGVFLKNVRVDPPKRMRLTYYLCCAINFREGIFFINRPLFFD